MGCDRLRQQSAQALVDVITHDGVHQVEQLCDIAIRTVLARAVMTITYPARITGSACKSGTDSLKIALYTDQI